MRPYSTMLVEYTIEQFLKFDFGLIVLIKYFLNGKVFTLSDNFTRCWIDVAWQVENFWAY